MRILALDTVAEYGSLALFDDDSLLEQVPLHAPAGFGAVLFDELAALLRRHAVAINDIGLFAAGAGPGSFTGIRVGLAAVKGLAATLGRPVLGVSNLQALASCGATSYRAAILDARRDEIYGAVYDDRLNVVVPEVVTPIAAFLTHLPPSENLEIVAADLAPFRAALPPQIRVLDGQRHLAAAIGRVALHLYREGASATPDAVDANYVRRSDAELFWKDA